MSQILIYRVGPKTPKMSQNFDIFLRYLYKVWPKNAQNVKMFLLLFKMQYLKPKLGIGTVLEDTPAHLPDVSFVQLKDIIAGPIQVVPMRGEKRDIPDYTRIKSHFEASKKIDLDKLFNIFMDKTN